MLGTALMWLTIAFIASVLYKLVTRNIATRGLLSSAGSTSIDPERLQALIVSLASISAYAASVLHIHAAGAHLTALPDVPNVLLEGVLASQVLYLAGKLTRMNK